MEPLEEARRARDSARREVEEILARIEACVVRGERVPEEMRRECAERLARLREANARLGRAGGRPKLGAPTPGYEREWT